MSRIVNLMAADTFFNKPRGKVATRIIDYERFTLTPIKARKKLSTKVAKVSTTDIGFEQWQIELAERVYHNG